ncbi:MAG TPA: LacI family DNA-binding transcriptional regulator [Chitinophagaceae bacterium]|nr:LacI family DNA-binding transcriptional regulator [Chitinophagaceae bacterium]
MKKGVTIKDIAQKLNMSISTVSKALHKDSSISTLTKERVEKQADEWNYVPNEAARHFKLNKTFTLGLIIPDLLDQFFVLAINGVEKIAIQEKYNIIISQSHEDAVHEEKIVNTMIRNRVDGLIIAISKNTNDMSSFQKLINIGIPVVFFARPPKANFYNYVTANNEDGAMKAMEFLFKKGHTRIAHIMGPESLSVSQLRFEGYKKSLQQHNIVFDPALVKMVDLTPEATFNAMQQLMKMKSPPTAIFTFKNYISLDAINYLKTKSPAQLKKIDVVGFGNLPLIRHLDHKPAASIEENSYEMGEEAARLIFQHIQSEDSGNPVSIKKIQIPCRLVIHKK